MITDDDEIVRDDLIRHDHCESCGVDLGMMEYFSIKAMWEPVYCVRCASPYPGAA